MKAMFKFLFNFFLWEYYTYQFMSLELLCVAQGCLKKDTQVAKVSKRNLVVIILNLKFTKLKS